MEVRSKVDSFETQEVAAMSEEVRITCPHCSARFRLKGRHHLGKVKPCPKCGEEFELVDSDESLGTAETIIRGPETQADIPSDSEPPKSVEAPSRDAPAASETRRPAKNGIGRRGVGSIAVCLLAVVGLVYGAICVVGSPTGEPSDVDRLAGASPDEAGTIGDDRVSESRGGQSGSATVISLEEPSGSITAFRPPTPETLEVSTASASTGEWTQFRGPDRLNISHETGLLTSWPEDGPPLLRVIEGLGVGYSSVSISDGVIFTLGSDSDSEFMIAFDAETGEQRWSTRLGQLRNDAMGNGPQSTPTVDGDKVCGLSANGDLLCAHCSDGSVVWRMNILEEFGARNITWGISESPLIDGDKLICTPGGSQATMVALDKNSGRVIWKVLTENQMQAGYASPVKCRLAGVDQYITFAHTGVFGVNLDGDHVLWSHSEAANETANCSTPIPWNGDSVFYASSYGTGGALVKIDGGRFSQQASTKFFTRKMDSHHGGMVVVDDHVYGTDGEVLICIDLRTGGIAWQSRSVGKGSVVAADGHLYLRSEEGPVALVELNPTEYVEKGRFSQQQRSDRRAWPHPVVCGKRLYLRDQDKLLVYDVAAE